MTRKMADWYGCNKCGHAYRFAEFPEHHDCAHPERLSEPEKAFNRRVQNTYR